MGIVEMYLCPFFLFSISYGALIGREREPEKVYFDEGISGRKFSPFPYSSQESIVFIDDSKNPNFNENPNRRRNNSQNNHFFGENWNNTQKKEENNAGFTTGNGSWLENNNNKWESFSNASNNLNNYNSNQDKFIWNQNSNKVGNENEYGSGQTNGNKEADSFTSKLDKEKTKSSKRRLLPEGSCGIELPRRILGGSNAEIDEFPWLALLQYRSRAGEISHDCGGALISARYVLTAAHCTKGVGVTTRKLKLEKVRLGEWDLSTTGDCQQELCSLPVQDIEIESIIEHKDYRPRKKSQNNDIALIRLMREPEMNQFVQPICLPLDAVSGVNFEGKTATVAGWGRTSNVRNSNSNIKMKVELPVVTWDACRSFYESFYSDVKIDRTQMCAGGKEGKDTCQGDSGGPLMRMEEMGQEFRWVIIGIVSSGPAACGVEGRPSLYTRVPDFIDWILDNVRD